jgi:hypothetical protein
MDLVLVLLICATAGYAGVVVFVTELRERGRSRALQFGAVAALAVAAGFFLMVALAQWNLFAAAAAVAVFSGTVAYLVVGRDISPERRPWITVGAALLVTVAAVLVLYLAVIAFIGAVGVYRLVRMPLWTGPRSVGAVGVYRVGRLRLRTGLALFVMGTSMAALLAGAVAMFAMSLSRM